jgi:Fe-S cluster assembly protein SufD
VPGSSTTNPLAEPATSSPALPFLEAVRSAARDPERAHLLERFLEAGLPTSKDEEWKYTSLRLLGESTFFTGPAGEPDGAWLEGLPGLTDGPRIVFWNGRLASGLTRLEELPEGVSVAFLADLLADRQVPAELGEIAKLEGKLGSTNDERFLWLNGAAFADGLVLDVAAGASVETPVQIVFLSDGAALSFPRLLVRLGANAQAKIVEFHSGEGRYATFPVEEIDLKRGANLEHTRLQDDSTEAFHIALLAARQEEDSTYTSNSAQFGARIGRLDANVWVGGEHAETWLNGAYVGAGEQHLDNHTRIDHAVPNCHSFEVYKGILGGRANGVFNGKIFVYPDAQKTDAKQTNQALLLSPTATVDTKPQLEIFADDVKCTHGATVGQLREDALFYMRSRGIPHSQAKDLLVYAFAAEVLERITVEEVRVAWENRLFAKLAEGDA